MLMDCYYLYWYSGRCFGCLSSDDQLVYLVAVGSDRIEALESLGYWLFLAFSLDPY